jgi:hypothetical protein
MSATELAKNQKKLRRGGVMSFDSFITDARATEIGSQNGDDR